MVGKEGESFPYLIHALGGSSLQMEGPGQAGVQPGRIGILLEGRLQQVVGLGKTVAAEGEHHPQAGGPGIVGQMRRERKSFNGRVEIVVYMEGDPAQGGQQSLGAKGKIGN